MMNMTLSLTPDMILSSPLTVHAFGPSPTPTHQNWIRSDLRQVVTWNGPGCGVLKYIGTVTGTIRPSSMACRIVGSGSRLSRVALVKHAGRDAEQTLQDQRPLLLPPYLMFWALCSGHTWSSSAKDSTELGMQDCQLEGQVTAALITTGCCVCIHHGHLVQEIFAWQVHDPPERYS